MYKINVPKLCRLHTTKHNHISASISIHKNTPDISNYSNYIWLNISRWIKIQLHPDFWLTKLVKHNSTGCNWTKAGKSLAYSGGWENVLLLPVVREIVELILVLVWGGGDSLLSQSAAVRLLFLDHHPFWVVHLICIHLFPAEEAFSSLRHSLSISQNPAASSHYLLRNENTARRRREKKKKEWKEMKKERGRKQKGGGKRQHVLQSKTKAEGWYKGIHCVCLCLVFYSPLEAGTVLC